MSWRSRVQRSLEKNVPEIRALISGRIRRLLDSPLPVFCFHRVTPEEFEADLRFLAANGYRTADGETIRRSLEGEFPLREGRVVGLTFDDATVDFWTTAYPLLRKHGFQAVLFAIPGLTREGEPRPTMEDVWNGNATRSEVFGASQKDALCTWSELEGMHVSGSVDIQSHSLTHRRVPVSPTVVDFLHPRSDRSGFRNVDIPAEAGTEGREPRLGRPIFRSAPRLAARLRFLEDPAISAALADYVAARGEADFFSRKGWEKELRRVYRKLAAPRDPGFYETAGAMRADIRQELARSKALLESRLPGKTVDHICYPWFRGAQVTDEIAASVGYRVAHYGLDPLPPVREGTCQPGRAVRIPGEFLRCLSGNGNEKGVARAWVTKTVRYTAVESRER